MPFWRGLTEPIRRTCYVLARCDPRGEIAVGVPGGQGNDQVHHHEQNALQPVRLAIGNEVVHLLVESELVAVSLRTHEGVNLPEEPTQRARSPGSRQSRESGAISSSSISVGPVSGVTIPLHQRLFAIISFDSPG